MGPPLMPTQAGFALLAARPAVQVELFLDLICPFSCKMYQTVANDVLPALRQSGTPVSFVVQQVCACARSCMAVARRRMAVADLRRPFSALAPVAC